MQVGIFKTADRENVARDPLNILLFLSMADNTVKKPASGASPLDVVERDKLVGERLLLETAAWMLSS